MTEDEMTGWHHQADGHEFEHAGAGRTRAAWGGGRLLAGVPPGSSVHRVLQARILQWLAMPFSRRSS